MITKSKKNLAHSSILKVLALIFGYAFWFILAKNQIVEIKQNIPLTFYFPQNHLILSGPTSLEVGLVASRLELKKLDPKSIGAHIDTSDLNKPGIYALNITPEHIFLPSLVKMLYYKPMMINIELSEQNFNEQN